MKKLFKMVVASWLAYLPMSMAQASPYFRLIDVSRPQVIAGAFYDPANGKGTQAGSAVALITHSPKDGCLLPAIVCEDWSPLIIGGTFTGPNKLFAIGPSFNLAPLVNGGLLALLNKVTNDGYANELKALLSSSSSQNLKLSLSVTYALAPGQNYKGYIKFFTGPSWQF